MMKNKKVRQVLWYVGIALFIVSIFMLKSQKSFIGWFCFVFAIAAVFDVGSSTLMGRDKQKTNSKALQYGLAVSLAVPPMSYIAKVRTMRDINDIKLARLLTKTKVSNCITN